MKLLIIASTSFNDTKLMQETLNTYTVDEYIVRQKTHVFDFIKDLGVTYTTFNKYDELTLDNDTEVLAFWDGNSKNVAKLIDQYKDRTKVVMFTDKTHKAFMEEIAKIKNEKWREGCLELVKKLPNYFWAVAASSSGKYHPKCDLGYGGLVRHSIMVTRFGDELVYSEMFIPDNDVNKDIVRVACLFHDCLKQGRDAAACRTVFEHPLLAYDFLKEELKNYIDEENLNLICDAVKTHMGKWTTSQYDPDIVLEVPTTPIQKLVHLADFVASRKCLDYEE